MNTKTVRLELEDGNQYSGQLFGFGASSAGEVVFNTGMVGYPETLTDPSYAGQILVLTYPMVGNYGVPQRNGSLTEPLFESDKIQIKGLIISDLSEQYDHYRATRSLTDWLQEERVPGIRGIDTRALTQHLRRKGTMLGRIVVDESIDFYDPNRQELVRQVSPADPCILGSGKRRIGLLDCGCKASIVASLLKKKVEVLRLPWNADLSKQDMDALLISNGPGNPEMCTETLPAIRYALDADLPILGICLGHQLLALAVGARTYKLKYGHRGQNQPVREMQDHRCLITSQNHGYAVDADSLPAEWAPLFTNLNDGTNEGLIHQSGRYLGVQFHPEAAPGPVDAGYLFECFINLIK